MDNRRIETAPAWLVTLAACALVMSWAVTREWSKPTGRVAVEPPRRSQAPLRWPIAELRPLPVAELAAAASSSLAPAETIRIAAPRLTPPALSGPSEADLLAIAPLRAAAEASLLVLLPQEPAWRVGDSGPVVVSAKARRAWSIASVDTLALARRLGRKLAEPFDTLAEARVALANTPVAWIDAPGEAPVRRVAAVGPVLRSAAPARTVRVIPVESRDATPQRLIVDYLLEADTRAFPVAEALGEQLDRVARDAGLAPWAWDVAFRLRRLAESRADDPAAAAALRALERQTGEALARSETLGDAPVATELRRAAYGLTRRTDAWRAEQTQTLALMERRAPASERLSEARWAMAWPKHGAGPGAMLADTPGRANVLRVAQRLERYEAEPSSRLARSLAESATRLAETGEAGAADLATAIESNYRNANVRIAVAAELVERLLPSPEPITAPVRDRIAGTPVSGRSTTRTELAVRLAPDDSAWRLGLEARGVVASQTYSRGGPAVIGSRGTTSFVAKKLVVLTPDGLRSAPAVATARTGSQRLTSLRTDYDRVPLVGGLVRNAARDEYGRLRGRALAQTQRKVQRQASATLDDRVTSGLAEVEQRFAREVTERLEGLGLRVEPIELRTTERRLIGRVRVAGEAQLAAHTPRMRAPSDSLLSVQLHESMLNNALEGLDLAGETLTADELRGRLAERLRLPPREQVDDDTATLRFAAEDPIRFRLSDGRAELTLTLDELAVRGRRHRNFRVHTFYRPEVEGVSASLVQEGTPHIEGRLRTASRIHLHGVMGKVLGDNERIPLVRVTDDTPGRLAKALVGLATNQLVIEDGWLGLAIGPQRPGERMALQVGSYVR